MDIRSWVGNSLGPLLGTKFWTCMFVDVWSMFQFELMISRLFHGPNRVSSLTTTLGSMSVPIGRIREWSSTLVACTLASVEVRKICGPMSQEIGFRCLAQVLDAVLAIGSWTSWLVPRDPMYVEPLRISKVKTSLFLLTFLSWTMERPTCIVAHLATGLEYASGFKCLGTVRQRLELLLPAK